MKSNRNIFLTTLFATLILGVTSCGSSPSTPSFEDNLNIVYKENGSLREKALATDLVDALKKAGVNYTLVNDSETHDNAINIGRNESSSWSKETPSDKYGVYKDNKKILIDGSSVSSLIDGTRYIYDLIIKAKQENKSVFSSVTTDVTNSYHDYGLKIMSYNLLTSDKQSSSGETIYKKDRLPRIAKVVLDYLPDSFGTQEFNTGHVSGDTSLWNYLGDTYAKVGGPRYHYNKDEEGTPIFYNYNTVELVDYGSLWPTDNPYVPTVKYDESSYMRIFTWAVFKKISSGKKYLHINTHLDLKAEGRLKQIKAIEKFASNYYDKMPVFITADYNDDYTNTNPSDYCYGVAIKYLLEEKNYVNTAFNATTKSTGNTFPTPTFNNEKAVMIDYCMHYGTGIFDNVYKIHKDKVIGIGQSTAGDTSDHYPTYYQFDCYNPLSSNYEAYDYTTNPYSGSVTAEINNNFTSEYPFMYHQPAAFASYSGGSWLNNDTKGSEFGAVKNLSNNDNSYIQYNVQTNNSAPADLDIWLCNARISENFDLGNIKLEVNGTTIPLLGLTLPSSPDDYYKESHLILKNVKLNRGSNTIKFTNIGSGLPNMISLKAYSKATAFKSGGVNGMQSNVVNEGSKVYFVTKGVVNGSVKPEEVYIDLRQGNTNYVGTNYNVTIDPLTNIFTSKIDVTGYASGTYYPHFCLAGQNFDAGNGDVLYPRDDWSSHEGELIPNTSAVTYGGKTYKAEQHSRMPTLVVA